MHWSRKPSLNLALLAAYSHSFLPREEAWGLCKSEALQTKAQTGLGWCSLPGGHWHRVALPSGERNGGSVCAEQQLSRGDSPSGASCWWRQVLRQLH